MARWDPFAELSRMEREMRRLFDDVWAERRWRGALPAPKGAELPAEAKGELIGTPAVDLVDKGDTLVLRSEMPGVKKEDVKLSVTEDSITISGKVEQAKEEKKENYYYAERTYSSWQRSIPLPVEVKPDAAKAKYENGVLEVTFPKSEKAKAKVKEIKVE